MIGAVVFDDGAEITAIGTRPELIRAGIAEARMFPRKGRTSTASDPVPIRGGWRTHRTRGGRFIVTRFAYSGD